MSLRFHPTHLEPVQLPPPAAISANPDTLRPRDPSTSGTAILRALADAKWATGHTDYDIAIALLQRALEQAPADRELRTELCDAIEEKTTWIAKGIKAVGGNIEGVISREIGRSLGELA